MSKKYPRYLTKSRFKLATECPSKLYYTRKVEYADQKLEDSFLMALAEGGFQIGELAKCYFPGGHEVHTLDHAEAEQKTLTLLQQENVIIFEAAIRYNNLFIRIDVLSKRGNHFDLIEVKAKSIDSDAPAPFLSNKGTIYAKWKPYLYDVAFQKYVLSKTFPESHVSGYLMLTDKSASCPTDGLNQKFIINTDEHGRKGVKVSKDLSAEDLATEIMCRVNVDEYIDIIYAGAESKGKQPLSFIERITSWTDHYVRDEKIHPIPSAACGSCEFYTTEADEAAGLKSGFKASSTLHDPRVPRT